MNNIFNAFVITKNDNVASIYNTLEDFINHLHKDFTTIDVVEFSNCISLFARSKNDTLCLIFDGDPKFKNALVGTTNTIFNYLNGKLNYLTWDYIDKKDYICDYQSEIKKDDIKNAIKLRKELVKSVLNDEDMFINISKLTKQQILDKTYKIQDEYATKCIFMNAIRLTLNTQKTKEVKSHRSSYLNNEENAILNSSNNLIRNNANSNCGYINENDFDLDSFSQIRKPLNNNDLEKTIQTNLDDFIK